VKGRIDPARKHGFVLLTAVGSFVLVPSSCQMRVFGSIASAVCEGGSGARIGMRNECKWKYA